MKIYPPGFKYTLEQMTESEWISFRKLGKRAKEENWTDEKLKEEVRKLVKEYNDGREERQKIKARNEAKRRATQESIRNAWRPY